MYKKADFFISDNNIISTRLFDIKELEKGFSIYEVIKISKGIPLFFENHLKRLHNSAKLKKVKINYGENEIKTQIYRLIDINKINEGRLKFAVRFHKSGDKLIIFFLNPISVSESEYKEGVKIISVQEERKNPNAKIINYKLRTYINNLIKNNDIFEVLLINKNNYITECSKSNIFFVKENNIYTPSSEDILCGITRKYILQICKKKNIKVNECKIKSEEINSFDSVFITGTSIGILPVRQIDNFTFDIKNKIISELSEEYNKITEKYISDRLSDNFQAILRQKG